MWAISSIPLILLAMSAPSSVLVSGQTCGNKADLFFVIDGSESVQASDFTASKNFVIDVLDNFDVRDGEVHVGANVFGTILYDGINLFGPSQYMLLTMRLRTLRRTRAGMTRTNLALQDMRNQFRDRGRAGVTKIGVVITDGKSVDVQATAIEAAQARSEGINIVAVGVGSAFSDPAQGQVSTEELVNIAGDQSRVRKTLDISTLVANITDLLEGIICPAPDPATTTAQPTTTTTTAPDSGGLDNGDGCTDCMIGEHHGYWKHPQYCNKFIRIYSDANGDRKSITQKCKPGMFWDQSLLTCVRPELVDCENDPCKNLAVASYDIKDVCSAFVQCINGRSFRTCCEDNQRYVAGQGCVNDVTCRDSCNGGEGASLHVPVDCASVSHPTNSRYYIQDVPGHGNITRLCPEGTSFVDAECGCRDDNSTSVGRLADCNPAANFPFGSDFSDVSGNRLYAGTQLVSVDNSAASFAGDGMINIYRFSKDDFGEALVIRMKFKADTAVGNSEALVTNCIYGSTEQASVAITVDRTSGDFVNFRTDTDEATESVQVPFDPARTNDLIYIYDGSHLTGIVNNVKVQTPLSGKILLSTSGIIIGAGSKLNHLNGNVAEFELYKCFPAFAEGLRS